MAAEGDYPKVLWQYADAVAGGTTGSRREAGITVEESYRAGRSADSGPRAAAVGSVRPMTLPLLAKGKVREIYDLGDDLLMVASDRISTYDVVHPTEIPDKGKVLTGLSVLWFDLTAGIVPNHFLSATDGVPEELRGRALRVKRLEMLPVECVVRGYITGSGWKDYQAHRRGVGHRAAGGAAGVRAAARADLHARRRRRRGPRRGDRLRARRPSWSARRELAERLRDVSIAVYERGRRARARARRDPRRHEVRVRLRRGRRR